MRFVQVAMRTIETPVDDDGWTVVRSKKQKAEAKAVNARKIDSERKRVRRAALNESQAAAIRAADAERKRKKRALDAARKAEEAGARAAERATKAAAVLREREAAAAEKLRQREADKAAAAAQKREQQAARAAEREARRVEACELKRAKQAAAAVERAARLASEAARKRDERAAARVAHLDDVVSDVLARTMEIVQPQMDVPRTWTDEDDVRAAQEFRNAVNEAIPRHICCVCSTMVTDVKSRLANVDSIPNLEVLAVDGPQSSELPRDALTRCTVGDKEYCLERAGK